MFLNAPRRSVPSVMIGPMYSLGAMMRAFTNGSATRSMTAAGGILAGFSISIISPSVR